MDKTNRNLPRIKKGAATTADAAVAALSTNTATSKFKFVAGDIVFAKKNGYVHWPARLISVRGEGYFVKTKFFLTDGIFRVPRTNIFPYNEQTKSKYVTARNLAYEDFCTAFFLSERLLGVPDDVIIETAYKILHPNEEDTDTETADTADPNAVDANEVAPMEVDTVEVAPVAVTPDAVDPDTLTPDSVTPVSVDLYVIPRKELGPQFPQKYWDIKFVKELRSQEPSLHAEPRFIELINILRDNLTKRYQNFQEAESAFEELNMLPLSQYILVRNYMAVDTIRLLCNFKGSRLADVEYETLREYANVIFKKFQTFFVEPFRVDFWTTYCLQYDVYRRYTEKICNE